MSHERYHDLLSLSLYDELDPAERTELEAHLAACADCRRWGDELEAALGPHRDPSGRGSEAPPDDWALRLERVVADRGRPRLLRRALPFAAGVAAGLAAGAFLMAAWRPPEGDTPAHGARPPATVASAGGYVESAEPPPAPVRSRLSALAAARR